MHEFCYYRSISKKFLTWQIETEAYRDRFDVFRTLYDLLFNNHKYPPSANFYFGYGSHLNKKRVVKRLNEMLVNDLDRANQEDFNNFILV